LELAPTCNVQIGAVPAIGQHPVAGLLRRGFRATVNTDNRLMSNVSVSGEVHAVASAFALTTSEVGQIALNGIDASFAEWSERSAIRTELVHAYGLFAGG
jgi:adenosine deaminase